jgi:hypothetical protein
MYDSIVRCDHTRLYLNTPSALCNPDGRRLQPKLRSTHVAVRQAVSRDRYVGKVRVKALEEFAKKHSPIEYSINVEKDRDK